MGFAGRHDPRPHHERIKAIENSPARQRHAESRVFLDKLETSRQNERKAAHIRYDGANRS